MAGEHDDRLQALSDRIETDRLSTQEQFRTVNDTLVRHGVSLAKLERGQQQLEAGQQRLEEGLGNVETALTDQSRMLGEILSRLPAPGSD